MDNVRVAVIGAGSLANAMHYPSLKELEGVDLVGICDLDEDRLQQTAQRFGIAETFHDYRRMLADLAPDAVYALMPPHILFDVAMDVLESGHHLFIEKPPAVTTHQARALARAAEQGGLITAVGFQRRYHPLLHACYERAQAHGQVHQVTASFYKNAPPADPHPYYRGAIDILHCDAIHAVDALRYYCGLAEVRDVVADVRQLDCWYPVSFNALVSFENGVTGVLLTNWRTGRRLFRFELHAYGASAYVDLDGQGTLWADNAAEPEFGADYQAFADSQEPYIHQGFLAENAAFVDAVRSGQPLHNSLQDAVKSMALVDQIYQQAM